MGKMKDLMDWEQYEINEGPEIELEMPEVEVAVVEIEK